MYTIKLIKSADKETINKVKNWEEQEWGPEGVTSTDNPFAIAGAYFDDMLVGMTVLASRDLEPRPLLTPWIASVYVQPRHRGKGLAKRLMTCLEQEAIKEGFKTLWLYTEDTALYSSQGWIYVETLMFNDVNIHIMKKDI